MITKTQSFQTSDNQIHPSFEVAQKHELECFIKDFELIDDANASALAEKIIARADELALLLSAKPRKPRVVKPKPAKVKPAAVADKK
jgi:hypothetical protein